MPLGVADRGLRIAIFRFIHVRLMEVLAAWTPTTPEMEAKVMFGRHIWDCAQHADALGKRTFELRRPEQDSHPPVEAYLSLLEEIGAASSTGSRLASFYEVVLPGLDERYARYVDEVDALLDAPSLVIIERIRGDLVRQRREAARLGAALALGPGAVDGLRARERAVASIWEVPGG